MPTSSAKLQKEPGGFLKADRFSLHIRKKVFCNEGGETLAQVAQRGRRCPIPGNIQGQVGWGSKHPDPVEDVHAHCREVGLDGLQRSLPTQTTL